MKTFASLNAFSRPRVFASRVFCGAATAGPVTQLNNGLLTFRLVDTFASHRSFALRTFAGRSSTITLALTPTRLLIALSRTRLSSRT